MVRNTKVKKVSHDFHMFATRNRKREVYKILNGNSSKRERDMDIEIYQSLNGWNHYMHTDTTRHKEDENSSSKRETQREMYKPLNDKENRNV
mgnify:FL=1